MRPKFTSYNFQPGMNRSQRREIEAERVALRVLDEYGPDPSGYEDRLLALCNGVEWLANAVSREIERLTGRDAERRKKKAKARFERQRQAA